MGSESPWLILPADPRKNADHRAVACGAFSAKAATIAFRLREMGATSGDRILVIAENSEDTCALLIGTFAAGLVAVPVAPRVFGMGVRPWLARLQLISNDCQARFIVGRGEQLRNASQLSAVQPVSLEQLTGCIRLRELPSVDLGDIALIQYTSGTTSSPRGAAITHSNILQNITAIGEALEIGPSDIIASWLPLFHDMGLIGSMLLAFPWLSA